MQQTIAKDLAACVGADVEVSLFKLDAISSGSEADSGFLIAHPKGKCIDKALEAPELRKGVSCTQIYCAVIVR